MNAFGLERRHWNVSNGRMPVNRKIIKPTPFGSVGVIWTGIEGRPKIIRILLSRPGLSAVDRAFELYPDSKASSCEEIDEISAGIRGMLEGEDIRFSLDVADLGSCSQFQQRVLRAERRIPRGSTSSYGIIADYIGERNAARAVGNALANNPFPLIVPCHRAIRSNGDLGGFQGGIEMKRYLLEKEGILFDDSGRVDQPHFHYDR